MGGGGGVGRAKEKDGGGGRGEKGGGGGWHLFQENRWEKMLSIKISRVTGRIERANGRRSGSFGREFCTCCTDEFPRRGLSGIRRLLRLRDVSVEPTGRRWQRQFSRPTFLMATVISAELLTRFYS